MFIICNMLLLISFLLLMLKSYNLVQYDELNKKSNRYAIFSSLLFIYIIISSLTLIKLKNASPYIEAIKFIFIFWLVKVRKLNIINSIKSDILKKLSEKMQAIYWYNIDNKDKDIDNSIRIKLFNDIPTDNEYGYFEIVKEISSDKLSLTVMDKTKQVNKTVIYLS